MWRWTTSAETVVQRIPQPGMVNLEALDTFVRKRPSHVYDSNSSPKASRTAAAAPAPAPPDYRIRITCGIRQSNKDPKV